MAATARRTLLLAALPAGLRADDRSDVLALLGEMAADLANGLGGAFVKAFVWEGNERAAFRQEIEALLATAEVSGSVELREFTSSTDKAEARVDWYLYLRARSDVRIVKQKREVLKMFFVRQGKKWRVESFAPRDFFTYPQ
jgi:hypothetical protein